MPERDAVREALVNALNSADDYALQRLASALGLKSQTSDTALADALLSRAQPEGERPCTNPHNDTSDPNRHCWHTRETCCHCETSRDATRPAPVVTEAVTDAMGEALVRELARQGYGSIRLTDARSAIRAALAAARGEGA